MNKIVEVSTPDFFTQKIKVGEVKEHSWVYCEKLCADKKVLHIGCSDFPLFTPEGNLHLHLTKFAKEIHGVDIVGLDELRKYYDGNFFDDILSADERYDVILVPNIIEHLPNPGDMVNELFLINFQKMFVLVPNYKVFEQSTYENGIFTEKIHPDHFCWYSPYTLYNLFKKEIEAGGYEYGMNFFDNQNMISILITKT